MRWSIIRLIWLRELRDQLRDRRTVAMIVVLPMLIYPILGLGLFQLAGLGRQQYTVGVYNADQLPKPTWRSAGQSPLPAAAWLAPAPVAPVGGPDWLAAAAALSQVGQAGLRQDYPPLLVFDDAKGAGRFPEQYFEAPGEADSLVVKDLGRMTREEQLALQNDSDKVLGQLRGNDVEVVLVVPPGFTEQLRRGERPVLYLAPAGADERSRAALNRVSGVVARWKKHVKEVRLMNTLRFHNYDEAVVVWDPDRDKPANKRAAEGLFELMGRIFPFLLVMWSLAGALYPAVDLCAGEKERGTMETLLISPVSREEIVYGKFLAIWVFSGATAFLNLLSMALTTWQFLGPVSGDVIRPEALGWSALLVLPLSAFFSALCLAVGAYARSSKEGQYYLMPLFLVTMPLIFLTLVPGVQLNPFYCMVPVTGVALLLQELIAATPGRTTWLYFLPVLAPMALYGWLALRWAVLQFKREEVLFREAERLDLGLWLRRLFRHKEAVPSVGQAVFCFGVILLLRWASLNLGAGLPLTARAGIAYLAFVLVPPVFMALLLTTRPLDGLGLRLPAARYVLLAVLLALSLLPPLAELTAWVVRQFPRIERLLSEQNPLTAELQALNGDLATWWQYPLVWALLSAVSEELAFRGYILGALRRRFGPWAAVLLQSFLFACYHANVFQFAPAFVLGAVLGLLALRSGSVLPGVVFHLLYNGLLLQLTWLAQHGYTGADVPGATAIRLAAVALGTLVSLVILWRLATSRAPRPAQPAVEAFPADPELVSRPSPDQVSP